MAQLARLDGRLARSARTRHAVVDALLDLLGEGDLRPTAARIADRAGVSLRLVFHHFDDLEAIYSEFAGAAFRGVDGTVSACAGQAPEACARSDAGGGDCGVRAGDYETGSR